MLHTVKGSPRIRDLSDSQLESILARRQTGRTGPQLAGFADEAEAVERVLAERKAAFQARTGATASVDEADEVVTQVKTAEERKAMADQFDAFVQGKPVDEVTDVGVAGTVGDLKWGGFRTAIEGMKNAELKLSGLDAISHMIVRGSEDVFKAFKTVPFKTTRTLDAPNITQRKALGQFVSGQPGVFGSSLARIFGHRPRGGRGLELFKPFDEIQKAPKTDRFGKLVKKDEQEVIQTITRGPGDESLSELKTGRSKGPKVLNDWFETQKDLMGKQAWKIEKNLNTRRVQEEIAKLHKEGALSKTVYTPEMLKKSLKSVSSLTPKERVIHDQAVALSVVSNRSDVLQALLTRKIGKSGRIPEFGGGEKDVLKQFNRAFQDFMERGIHTERPPIIDAINAFNDDITALLAAITAAEMMAIAGDPRATIGQPT